MKKSMNKIVVVFTIITILFAYVVPAFAVTDEQNNEEQITNNNETDETKDNGIDSLKVKKEELENAISETESQIGVVEGVLSAVVEEVESLSIKIADKKEEISNLEQEEIALNAFIEEYEEKFKQYTEKYEKEKKLLEERLVVIYEMGDIGYLDVLLKSESLSDFLSRYYLISEITESDYELVSSIQDSKQQIESISESLREKKEELEEDKTAKEKYQVSLSNMEKLKSNKIKNLNSEELELYNEIEECRNEIAKIEEEIKQLSLLNIGEYYIGGDMVWPTPGYTLITSQFGMRTHPITGIYKLHSGVDIGAPYGSTFVASNDGVVVKAEYNPAYGKMVIIDHGGGVTTLYAHGSEILVEVGQTVTQGTAVLKVGSTGYSTGPHAHFEIRINGQYVNPLIYVSPYTEEDNNEEIVVELNN